MVYAKVSKTFDRKVVGVRLSPWAFDKINNKYMETFAQIIGWIGAFLVVLAYFLVSYKKVDGASKIYQLMNLVGAVGVGVNAFYQQVWPPLAIQFVWGIIAIIALVRIRISQT